MKRNDSTIRRKDEIIKILLISLLTISSLSFNAQAQTNFAGKWEFDKNSSDKESTGDASFNGTIILEIKQTPDTISFTNTFFMPGREGISLTPDKFPANGKEVQDNSGTDPARKFIKWSPDKKVLTTSYIMTAKIDGVAQDFITTMTYKISEDGKTLLVSEFNKSKLNGEKTVKKVYKRK
jgi:hypothetical protein